jgi:hypothetical protein
MNTKECLRKWWGHNLKQCLTFACGECDRISQRSFGGRAVFGSKFETRRVQLKYDGTRRRREGKWRENWRMGWVASTLHTTSEHGVSSSRLHLKCDGIRWCTGGEVKGEKKRMEWVTSKRHMTAEHRLARAVQSLQADVHSSPVRSRLNWRPCRFNLLAPEFYI